MLRNHGRIFLASLDLAQEKVLCNAASGEDEPFGALGGLRLRRDGTPEPIDDDITFGRVTIAMRARLR